MIVSPFTPLFFIRHKTDGLKSPYRQIFAPTDRILLELLATPDEDPEVRLYREPGHGLLDNLELNEWAINDDVVLHFTTLRLTPGCYSVEIVGIGVCEEFEIVRDERILKRTTLIQYSHRDNRQRNDVVFFIDHMQYFFDFRVHGGFKDSQWSFSVEGDQFVTPYADIAQLYGLESTQKKFTLGGNVGVPVWYGEMLNRILVCSHVYFDGIKYTRKESNVPEMAVQLDGTNSFVFTQMLQQSVNLDPVIEQRNHLAMRRIDDSDYRKLDSNLNRIL